MSIKEDERLSNTERNLNEELMINTKNPAGKLSEREWGNQQQRNEQAKELESIEERLTKLNKERLAL